MTDEVDHWPEIKLDIQREYATPYSEVVSQRPGMHHVYVEAFAGAGDPRNALAIQPPFKEFHLVPLDGGAERLRRTASKRSEIHVHEGDCNRVLLEEIFPRVRQEDYRRGLCILDPHGLFLDWKIFAAAGKMQTIELFFCFPIQAIERASLDPDRQGRAGLPPAALGPMDRFWGDESWRALALPSEKKLFGDEMIPIRNQAIVESFRKRLLEQARFTFVPKPLGLSSQSGEIVEYLFFASHNVLGGKIVEHLFEKHAHRAESA